MDQRKHPRGLFQRPPNSGIWWICYFDQFGDRHREKIGPEQLAIAAYQKRKTEVREGRLFPNLRFNRITFGMLCDDFEKHSPSHWSKNILGRVKGWFEGVPASMLTPQRIDEKLNEMITKGRAPATANRHRATISTIYSWAICNGRAQSNPAKSIKLHRESNRVRFLTTAEEKKLRAVIRANYPDREPELDLAMNTGMRRANQIALKWTDVDVERRIIVLGKTKSGQVQYLPINDVAFAALKRLKRQKRETVCGPGLRYWFEDCREKAGLTDFRWHDLRHTFASRLAGAGVDLLKIKELMGHKTVTMVLRYAHLQPSHLKEAVNAICKPVGATHVATPTATANKSAARHKGENGKQEVTNQLAKASAAP